MDTLQCAIVNVKLKHYPKDLALRQEVAEKYSKVLSEKFQVSSQEPTTSNFQLPTLMSDRTSAWAQYSIRIKSSNLKLETSDSARSDLQAKLKEQGIPTAVHYPMPLHLQECFEYLGHKKGDFPICEQVSDEIMSLPMNPYLSDEEIEYINQRLSECLTN
jgi:UDP-2-acetamido-2-deoxy-ribo-hexuluronate aminotransferase